MNMKPWMTTVSAAMVLSMACAAPAIAADNRDHRGRSADVYDYARVLSAEPRLRYVTVTTPVKECWDDVEYYSVERRPPRAAGGPLFGAIVGGVNGHPFGSGGGHDAAPAVGRIIGAAGGHSAAPRAKAG
jgi:uncharacterized protein YcfJ